MKTSLIRTIPLALALLATPVFAQTPEKKEGAAHAMAASTAAVATAPDAKEMQEMMAKMTELGKPGENHKLLASLAGSWTYDVTMWMDPKAPPMKSKGTATRKPIMDGRFFIAEHSGKFQMPGPDGKMKDTPFTGMAIEGYDNVKKAFVSSWIDNMGTMILHSEGTYDEASKTFTYNANCEMMPGMPVKIRESIKIVDANHHTFEWYEDRGTGENKTMEINFTRKK